MLVLLVSQEDREERQTYTGRDTYSQTLANRIGEAAFV